MVDPPSLSELDAPNRTSLRASIGSEYFRSHLRLRSVRARDRKRTQSFDLATPSTIAARNRIAPMKQSLHCAVQLKAETLRQRLPQPSPARGGPQRHPFARFEPGRGANRRVAPEAAGWRGALLLLWRSRARSATLPPGFRHPPNDAGSVTSPLLNWTYSSVKSAA
jgi:hypothetical protein